MTSLSMLGLRAYILLRLVRIFRNVTHAKGQPTSLAQRWAKSGMPVNHEGRRVRASVGRESAGELLQIATETTDLTPN